MNTILVIEDNKDILDNIAEILRLARYEVLTADNGKAGLEIALQEVPDLIVCDVMMPELDGYGVLYLLHRKRETEHIPFVFITTRSERTDLRKAMEMGADDYLIKPFEDIELLHAIESQLKKRESLQMAGFGALEHERTGIHPGASSELRRLAAEGSTRMFKKNQVIHYEGDPAQGLYQVLSGRVKTSKMGEDGREFITGVYGPEQFFGTSLLLSGRPHTDTSTALEDCELVLFPKSELEEALLTCPGLAGLFIRMLSDEIREKDTHLLQMAYQSVRKKIAEALLRLFRDAPPPGGTVIVSRDDLAAMSGTASETVSRTLTEFRNEGLIGKKGGHMTLLDVKKMRTLKN
ncbi:MAG TPA: response regulator [Flavobacterium sp.]|nr:response regulator [Flavobacterium sp.]